MPNIDTAKTWFETHDYPTQEQFAQTFDWLRWKDERIPINEVQGLQDALNALALPLETYVTAGADHNYSIPAGYSLEQVWIVPIADCSPFITSFGSVEEGDIVPEDPEAIVTPAKGLMLLLNMFCVAAKTIVFKGLPIGSKIIIKKRKIL